MRRHTTGIVILASILIFAGIAMSQAGMRKSFRGNGDNHRNLVTFESTGQLQSTFALTSNFSSSFDVRLDSLQDGAMMEMNIDLSTLTTGNSGLDAETFSARFLDWKGATQALFRLIEFTPGRNYNLENEKAVPVSGRGVLTLGSRSDTVGVELSMRYLEGNEITRSRMNGDLLHTVGTIHFRLSRLGIEIPQEALLRLDDRARLKFDIYSSTAN